MSEVVTLTDTDIVDLGSEIAGFLMFREWNAPRDDRVGVRRVVLDDETIEALANEITVRLA
jgi:hypothetical protein